MYLNTTQTQPLGVHFTSWSLLWLTGQDSYYSKHHEWLPVAMGQQRLHTLHGFDMMECSIDKVDELPKHREGQTLFTAYVNYKDLSLPGWDRLVISYDEDLRRLADKGWRTVLVHDMDQGSDLVEMNLRYTMEREDLNDKTKRDQHIERELANIFQQEITSDNVSDLAMKYMVNNARQRSAIDQQVQEWIDQDRVMPITVSELLSGDPEVFKRIIGELGLRLHEERLPEWREAQTQWADMNRFMLTWRAQLPGWATAIVEQDQREMPALDHLQLAGLQRHLMLNYQVRLRQQISRGTSQDYHADLMGQVDALSKDAIINKNHLQKREDK